MLIKKGNAELKVAEKISTNYFAGKRILCSHKWLAGNGRKSFAGRIGSNAGVFELIWY